MGIKRVTMSRRDREFLEEQDAAIQAAKLEERERLGKSVEESLVSFRNAAEDMGDVSKRLHSRLLYGDIPWDAGIEIQAEFCGELREVQQRAERACADILAALEEPDAK